MKKSNPVMVKAGKKAWKTRKKNEAALQNKLSEAGRKSWETRRANKIKALKKTVLVKASPSKPVVKPVTKDFSVGEQKQKVREAIVSVLQASGVTGLVLTLSWYKFILEKMIVKAMPNMNFITCEYKPEIFAKLLETVSAERLKFIKSAVLSEIGTIIKVSAPNTYAHLLLDYCGTIKKFGDDIRIAIENNIVVVGGTITVTLSQRNAKYTEINLKRLINEAGNKNYVSVFTRSYKDGDTMLTVIIKRVK